MSLYELSPGQKKLSVIYECAYEADVRKVGFHFICLGA